MRTFQTTEVVRGYDITPNEYERMLYGKSTMNLKNIDWKHVALIAITLIVGVYSILVKDGVPLPVQVGTAVLVLASIANWLNGSPVATPQQIATKTTRADMRALHVNREDKTQ